MAYYLHDVKKYSVYFHGGGKNVGGYPYRAIVGLRKDDGSLYGALYFHMSPATLPDRDTRNASTGYIWCHFTDGHFADAIDLLRNEKPVFLRWVGSETEGSAQLTTSLESVGEGEESG